MEINDLTKLYILFDELKEELNLFHDVSLHDFIEFIHTEDPQYRMLKKVFPNLPLEQKVSLLSLLKLFIDEQKKQEKIEIVVTLPDEINTRCRKTVSIVRQILLEAKSSILITGYAASEYFSEISDILIEKSKSDVPVSFYIDDNIHMNTFIKEKLLSKPDSLIKIFRYKKRDGFSSLHAKVILVDNIKALVSSSNLSYNGIVNNIEIGTLITGRKANEINELFINLRINNYFEEVKIRRE